MKIFRESIISTSDKRITKMRANITRSKTEAAQDATYTGTRYLASSVLIDVIPNVNGLVEAYILFWCAIRLTLAIFRFIASRRC